MFPSASVHIANYIKSRILGEEKWELDGRSWWPKSIVKTLPARWWLWQYNLLEAENSQARRTQARHWDFPRCSRFSGSSAMRNEVTKWNNNIHTVCITQGKIICGTSSQADANAYVPQTKFLLFLNTILALFAPFWGPIWSMSNLILCKNTLLALGGGEYTEHTVTH